MAQRIRGAVHLHDQIRTCLERVRHKHFCRISGRDVFDLNIVIFNRPSIGIGTFRSIDRQITAALKGVVRNGIQRRRQRHFPQAASGKRFILDYGNTVRNCQLIQAGIAVKSLLFNLLQPGRQSQTGSISN